MNLMPRTSADEETGEPVSLKGDEETHPKQEEQPFGNQMGFYSSRSQKTDWKVC